MSTPVRDSRSAPSLVGISLLFAAGLTAFTLPWLMNDDSAARFVALDTLLRSGTSSDVKYSLVGPVCAAPLWYAAPESWKTAVVWKFNALVFAGGAVGLWWALRPVLSAELRLRFLLLLAFASVVLFHATCFGGEPFTAMCVGVGTAAALLRRAWWGWPLAAIGAANVPATVVGLTVMAGVVCWHRRRLRYLFSVGLAVALILAENWIRRGNPLASGYDGDRGFQTFLPYSGQPGFSYPFLLGVFSILFSAGKGLFLFLPGLFLPLDDRIETDAGREADLRLLYWAWIGFVVGLLVVYAKWWSWQGSVFWGPRFFLFAALPAALVLARRSAPPFPARPVVNGVVLLALLLSCWVGTSGVVFRDVGPPECFANDYALAFAAWYVPELSPLWRPFVIRPSLDVTDRIRLGICAIATVYLAAPLARVVARQAISGAQGVWRNLRTGPSFGI